MKKIKRVKKTGPELLAASAVRAAKKTVTPLPLLFERAHPRLDVTRVKSQTFHMQARLILMGMDGISSRQFLAHIPCIITTVPELPEVVICEDYCYVLTRTYPLTYTSVLASKATRV